MQSGTTGRVPYMGGPNVGAGGAPGPVHPGNTSMLHQSFKNPNWPPNFINADNVLEYFCDPGNVFFDPSSCNQHLKMQNLNRPLQECLESMTGTQYALVGANPPLFVIVKQRRNSSVNVTPLCYYYIVNGTVYQCPDMYTFVQSKLIGAVDSLRRALEQSRQFSRYNVAKGYYWEFKEPTKDSVKTEEKEEEKPLEARSTLFQHMRTEPLIRDLIAKFSLPDDVDIEFSENQAEAAASTSADGTTAGGTTEGAGRDVKMEVQTGGGTASGTAIARGGAAASGRQDAAHSGPASVPAMQSSRHNGAGSGLNETNGPMSFPGPASGGSMNGQINGHETTGRKRARQ